MPRSRTAVAQFDPGSASLYHPAIGQRADIIHPNPRYRHISPHLLRHSFARNWKRSGGSLESLKRLLGHSSRRTTMDLYGIESQEETEQNYREIEGLLLD